MPTVAIAPKEDLPLKRQLASGMSLLATILLIVTMINLGPSIVFAAGLPDNLVTNPSLEEKVGADGLPPGWGKVLFQSGRGLSGFDRRRRPHWQE